MKTYARYKDSGISWIGEIPEHWDLLRAKYMFNKEKRDVRDIDDVVTCFRDGVVTLRKNRRTTGFTESLTEIGYQGIRKNDLVIHQMDAFAGSIGVSDSDGKGTSVYHCCTPLGDYDVFYYAFLLRLMAKKGFIQSLYRGIRERSSDFNFQVFGKQYLIVPPLSEQKAIADFLDEKTAKINELVAAKQKQIELLKEYKQSLIANAVTKGVNPKTKMKDSGINWIGQIPAHWELSRIRHYFAESDEKTFDESATLLSLSQYTGISLKSESPKVGMSEAETTEGYKVVHKGQFVMNIMLAWNGSYAVSDLDGVISPAYCVFDFVKDCDKWYFHYLLRIKAYSGAFKTLSKGIIDSRLRLYPNKFYTFPLIVPPIDEQKQIVAFINERVASINTQISSIEKQIENLNEYKQSLISDVVTGKVKV